MIIWFYIIKKAKSVTHLPFTKNGFKWQNKTITKKYEKANISHISSKLSYTMSYKYKSNYIINKCLE